MFSFASRARWSLPSVLALALVAACSSSPKGAGGIRQACYANGTCNTGLLCLSNVCVAPPDGGAGATGTAGAGGSGGSGTAGASAGTSGGGGATAGASGGGATAGASGSGGATAGASGSGGATAGASGGGGATAGASGGGGATAGASGGGGAAAGASGSGGATAGASGGGGATAGASGSGGAAGAGCPYKASYGNVIIASNLMVAQEQIVPATASQPQTNAVGWDGVIRNLSATPDQMNISLQTGFAPFSTAISPMTVDLSTQKDFATCGACVVLFISLNADATVSFTDPELFMPVSGSLNITAVPAFPATAGSRFTGTISNVVFEHVTIDPNTNATAKKDNCQITLTSAAFDAPVTNQ
jgi:hypothetical protein